MNILLWTAWWLLLGMAACAIGVYWGAYLQRTYGRVIARHVTHPDTHVHCDRHPQRCTYAQLVDDHVEALSVRNRYHETLTNIAQCDKCGGCQALARTALATNPGPR